MSADETRTANLQRAIDRVCLHTRLTRSLVAVLLAAFAREGWTLVETERLAELALRPSRQASFEVTMSGGFTDESLREAPSGGEGNGWWWRVRRGRHLRAVDVGD